MGAQYQVQPVRTLEAWRALAPQWNELLGASRADTVFLTWEWLSAWVDEFLAPGRELFVLSVRDGENLVGLAPWYLSPSGRGPVRLRRVRPLGTPETASDYLDVIARKGEERKVAYALYDFLFADGGRHWDQLALSDLPAASPFLAHFMDRLRQAGKQYQVDLSAHCPVVALPATTEELLAGLSTNRRSHLKRHLRIIEREGAVEFREHVPAGGGTSLEGFFSLYEKNWESTGAEIRPFFERYAARSGEGRVHVDSLACSGRELAALLHVTYRGDMSMILMAVDKSKVFQPQVSLGNLLVGHCLEGAIGRGIKTYDFLKGLEDYKFHWANGGRTTLALTVCRRGAAPVLSTWGGLLKAAAKVALR